MKLVAIEIAEKVERDIAQFLEESGKPDSMRFTRFIDLGGRQVELYLYPPQMGASVWCTIGIKFVFRTDQGECVLYSANLPEQERSFEDVLANPEAAKLPALSEKILAFLKDSLLQKVNEEGANLEGGGGLALGSEADAIEGAESDAVVDESPEETPLKEIASDSENAEELEEAAETESSDAASESEEETKD